MADELSVRLTLNEDATTKLRQVASEGRNAATALNSVGRSVDQAFKTSTVTSFSHTADTALSDVTQDAEELGSVLGEVFADFDASLFEDFGDSAEDAFWDATDAADDFSDAAERAGDSIDELSDAAERVGDSIDGIGEGAEDLGNLGNEAENAGQAMGDAEGKAINLSGALKKLFAVVSAAAVMKGISDFAKGSIEIGSNFETAMSEVQALSGATGADLEKLTATAREYGATTVFSATESASALKFMSLAGWDAIQSASALPGVLDLAASSGLSLSESSDLVTDYLSAFSMEASQATEMANLLAYAQANSNTSVAQLGEAYRNSAANLNSAGQDIYTVTSLLEGMANQGFKGSEAGTALSAMMRDITKQMSDGAIKIGNTSIAVQDAQGNFKDLTEILKDVEAATDGMGTAEKTAALSSTFTADSIKGMNLILNEGMDKISGYEEALRGADGAASRMAKTMNDNLAGDMANMNSAFEEMKIQVFENMEGPLREGVQFITSDVIPALTDWIPQAFGSAVNGIKSFASFVEPLFTTIMKNPTAVANVFKSMGAGFLAMKAVGTMSNIASSVSGITSVSGALKGLAINLFGSQWAAGAAIFTAAVAGVGLAIEKYNSMKIQGNLDAHFGDVHLDQSQIEALAGQIVDVNFTANMKLANTQFEEADQLVKEAETLLAKNSFLWWQINSVGIKSGVGEEIISNSAEFESSIKEALEKKEYAVSLTITGLLGKANAEPIVSQLQQWFAEDEANVTAMGAAVSDMLERAFKEGADTVNLETAATILQSKMLSMVDSTKMSEIEGQLKWLDYEMDGAVLDPESWKAVAQRASELVHEQISETSAAYQSTFGELERLATNNPERKALIDEMERVLGTAFVDYKNTASGTAFAETFKSLNTAYESEISSLSGAMADSGFFEKIIGTDFQSGLAFAEAAVSESIKETYSNLGSGTKGALAELYSSMAPTTAEMDDIITKAAEQGKAVPESLMNAYNDAIMLAAATGDDGALAQYMANQVASQFSSKEEFISALEKNGVNFNEFAEGYQEAFNKAFVETTADGGDFDLLKNLLPALSQDNVDWNAVEGYLNEYGYSIASALQEQGIDLGDGTMPVHAEGIKPDIDELATSMEGLNYVGKTVLDGGEIALQYTVNEGETLSGIMSQYGVVWSQVEQQIRDANPDIPDLNLIYPDQVINIPEAVLELTNVDSTKVGKAVDDSVQKAVESAEAANKTAEVGITVNTSTEAGINDTSGVGEAVDSTVEQAKEIAETKNPDITISGEVNAEYKAGEVTGAENVAEEISRTADETVGTASDISLAGEVNAEYEVGEVNGTETVTEELSQTANEIVGAVSDVSLSGVVNAEYEAGTVSGAADAADSLTQKAVESAEAAGGEVTKEIPASVVISLQSLNDAALSEGINGALENQPAVPVTVPADITISIGEVDTSSLSSGITEAVGGEEKESIPVTVPADITIEAGTIDTVATILAATTQTQSDLDSAFSTVFPVLGSTNVTLSQTNNVADVYGQVGSALQGAFNNGYSVSGSANVSIRVNYSIANPTATISIGGAGTGSGSVYASIAGHASGGYFDEPHLAWIAEGGSGEWVIPNDGSDHAKRMWAEAGEDLGMYGTVTTRPSMGFSMTPVGNGEMDISSGSTEKNINLNINGSGKMQISSGMSKETVLQLLMDNMKDTLLKIVEQEILEEGDGVYEF